MSRIWAIGDIHGCFNALEALISEIDPADTDTLVFLGDYVDRGSNTKGVIDYLIQLDKKHECYFLKGNHEIFMLNGRDSEERLAEWLYFGGDATLASYNIKDTNQWEEKVGQTHWDFLEDLLPYKQISSAIFVHAGLTPGKNLTNHSQHELFWKKYIVPEKYSDDHYVVCGHTSRKDGKIADFKHSVCIDTYCYGGQWLTGLNVGSGEYLQTNERRQVQRGSLT